MCHKTHTTFACGHTEDTIVRCGYLSQWSPIVPKRCLPGLRNVEVEGGECCMACSIKEANERAKAREQKASGGMEVKGGRRKGKKENEAAVGEEVKEGPVKGLNEDIKAASARKIADARASVCPYLSK
ncbi:hypothetical protein LTR37_011428 [Vermiconidia calcicola]|uniref:Uncharacterized protein n=1 Tax=Vermiconidia calcicola TaxID=1690605 RepID=A0ACC3N4X2_9PEZI|nr:hypothetical protein LTR37_011428 [Vermiconidia calcicola]